MLHLVFYLLVLWALAVPLSATDWLEPASDPEVVVVRDTEDTQFSFWSGPAGQEEWELNYGRATSTRVKGM